MIFCCKIFIFHRKKTTIMNCEDDILDTSRLQFEGDFDAQVQHILSFVRLTVEKVHRLKQLFDDLELILQQLAPGCHIEPFGSVVTGLGIKTSDVDCYVALPDGIQPSVQHVVRARNILRRYHRKFTDVFAITAAKVPIVKFLHVPTNRQCDVNFKSPAGVQNSKLIAFLLNWDQRALPLAVLIKYWSKVHKFTGTNLMANYALILMVIFYLQLMNILPPVCDLQKHVPSYMIDDWNTAFDYTMTSDSNNSDSLCDLMGGFFKCYSTFNFKENIISPYLGRVINRKCFENLEDVPDEYDLYKTQISRKMCYPLKIDTKICIQDPFEHNRNCTVAIFDKLLQKIISHFQFASKKFEEDRDNFLKAILTEDPTSLSHPNSNAYQKHVFQNKIKKHNPKQKKRHGIQTRFNKWFELMNNKRVQDK